MTRLILTFAAAVWLAGLYISLPPARTIPACIDAGFSPEHCTAWSKSK